MSDKRTAELEEAMSWPWYPVVTATDGGYMLQVPALDDFTMYSESEEELRAEWKDALRSHLMGYLSVCKAIPKPFPHVPELSDTSPGPVEVLRLDADLEVVGS